MCELDASRPAAPAFELLRFGPETTRAGTIEGTGPAFYWYHHWYQTCSELCACVRVYAETPSFSHLKKLSISLAICACMRPRALRCGRLSKMRHLGFESSSKLADSSAKLKISMPSGSATGSAVQDLEALPPELQSVAEAWADLPEVVRAGIVAMVRAADHLR
jgi:hypothetical protein